MFVPLDETIARSAARLRSDLNLSLLDAFQAASALASGCDAFLTNDLALKRVAALRVLVLDEFASPAATG